MARLQDIIGKPLSGEWGNDDDEGIGIPVLRTTNFTNEGIIDFKNVVTRIIPKKDLSAKYLRTGDIIIEKSGGSDKQPVGRVVYYDGPSNTYLFNNFTGVLRIIDTDQWDSKYLFYTLFANYQRGGTQRYQNKTTGLHNLKTDQYVKELEIPERLYQDQKQIVHILDKVSDLISLRKQQLDKLDELIKARFVEMFGDIHENRQYPYKSIESFTVVVSGGTPSRDIVEYWEDGTIPWVKTTELQNSIINKTEELITELGLKESSAKIVPAETILIAMYGQGKTRGMTAFLSIVASTNQACACILPSKTINQKYLWNYLMLSYDKLRSLAKGGNQLNLNCNIIKRSIKIF